MIQHITVIEANTRSRMSDFVELPRKLYAGVEQYVPDLDKDVRDTFNPKKNNALQTVDIVPFVAYKDGEVVGRVAGVINHKANEKWGNRVVRFSMLEVVDDVNVTQALLDTVAKWGQERGMNVIQGPLGITDFDKEGMLIEDFEMSGTFLEYWNPEYYKAHMEQLGYVKAVDWLHVRVAIPKEVPEKYARVARLSQEMFGLRVEKKTKEEARNGFAYEIFDLLNQSFSPLFGFSEFAKSQVDDFVNAYLPLIDMRMIPCVFNEKNELVCAALTINDFSEGLKKCHGRLMFGGWYHLLKALKWKKSDKAELMLIAVRPDMQGLGLNALIFNDLIPLYNEMGIKWAETGPQLEDNVKELSQWKPLNPQMVKRRRCWQKEIDV